MADVVEDFGKLFLGNRTVYGTDEGGCVRVEHHDPLVTTWHKLIVGHLNGSHPIGIYPHWLNPSGNTFTAWGCTDLDYTDDSTDARNIAAVLTHLGINAWVEISKSKGFHVWTFPTEPILASTMRKVLLLAHQVAEVPPKEVNPKQAELAPGDTGNYVRTPYPGALETGFTADLRRMMLGEREAVWHFQSFVHVALERRTEPHVYDVVAAKYKAPTRQVFVPTRTLYEGVLPPLAQTIVDGGPLEGSDRSTTMYRLGHILREKGFDAASTFAVLKGLSWSKFAGRSDEDQRLTEMVEGVYR